MFCLFLDNILKDFWGNSEGDVFIEATAKRLRLNKDLIDLNFYPEIYESPKFYELDADKNLILKNEIKTITEESSVNELGETVVSHTEVITYEPYKTIKPVVYFAKGLMIKPC